MKVLIILFIAICIITSCGPVTNYNKQQEGFDLPYNSTAFGDSTIELNVEQQSAFDALDELQVSGDGSNRLYSTFTNNYHPFYPPDTSVTITRSELLNALSSFLKRHYKTFSLEERNKLAETAVLAQSQYKMFLCNANSPHLDYEEGIPQKGVWVLPNVLGHRDVILEWD